MSDSLKQRLVDGRERGQLRRRGCPHRRVYAGAVSGIGIISRKDYKARSIAIARGDYKSAKGEPKIWFEYLQSLAQVLSNENREFLRIIKEKKPESIKELEAETGRKRGNLSRTLNTMAQYGIVDLVRQDKAVKPVVKATSLQVEFGLNNRTAA